MDGNLPWKTELDKSHHTLIPRCHSEFDDRLRWKLCVRLKVIRTRIVITGFLRLSEGSSITLTKNKKKVAKLKFHRFFEMKKCKIVLTSSDEEDKTINRANNKFTTETDCSVLVSRRKGEGESELQSSFKLICFHSMNVLFSFCMRQHSERRKKNFWLNPNLLHWFMTFNQRRCPNVVWHNF